MNTDQGSQTSVAFLTALQDAKIAISMDGKGAWRDNVFVERLWRTIKYEEVYLRAYRSVSEARRGLVVIWRSTTGAEQTPDQAYGNQPKPIQERHNQTEICKLFLRFLGHKLEPWVIKHIIPLKSRGTSAAL